MKLLQYSCIAAVGLASAVGVGCRGPERRTAADFRPSAAACCAMDDPLGPLSPFDAGRLDADDADAMQPARKRRAPQTTAFHLPQPPEESERPDGDSAVSLASRIRMSEPLFVDTDDTADEEGILPPGPREELGQRFREETRWDESPDDDSEADAEADRVAAVEELQSLVAAAMAANPQLQRLQAEMSAAWQRVPQLRSLPDPMLQGAVYGEPMIMGDGELRGTLMLSQTLPLLRKLDARGQQASFEALIRGSQLQAARQQITAEVKESWYRLYLLGQLLRINEANEQLVDSLLRIATVRVEVAEAAPGDVILGTLELSRLEEERLLLQQQVDSRRAMLNRLLGRPADAPIELPQAIEQLDDKPTLDTLRIAAFQQQPAIVAARLRTEATAWGIRLAELERVPDPTVSYERMFMRMNPGEHGSDPWLLGLGINLPLWHPKYQAMRREATDQHVAAHRGVDEVVLANESRLQELVAQSRAARSTMELYRQTILPQTRQAVEVDRRSYGQGIVQFERVIANARNLLTAETAYHRAVVEHAVAIARLEEAVGGTLTAESADPPELIPLPE